MKHIKSFATTVLLTAALTGSLKAQDSISYSSPERFMHMHPLVERSLNEVNRLLPKGKKTTTIKIFPADTVFWDIIKYSAFYNLDSIPNIVISSFLVQDTALMRATVFHEQSHAYFRWSVSDSARAAFNGLFTEALAHKFVFPNRPGTISIADLSDLGVDEFHPVFSMFDESNYNDKVCWEFGHPYDNRHELFASASAVLRFYPEEFLFKFGELYATNREGAEIVRRIAVTVLDLWKGSDLFDLSITGKMDAVGIYRKLK